MEQVNTTPLAQARHKAYKMVAGANPWEDPDSELVDRIALRILEVDTKQDRHNDESHPYIASHRTGGPHAEVGVLDTRR